MTGVDNIILTASGINKSFKIGKNRLHVLNNLEFSMNIGELVALMGPSGSGKSTLLNIVGGLLEADDGYVGLDGYSYGKKKPLQLDSLRRNSIGWVFQNSNLLEHLNVLDNVAFALTLSGFSVEEARDKARSAIEQVGLIDRMAFYPQQLSGGQSQRVSVARAIAGDKSLLLADEPTGNLDSESGKALLRLFQSLCHDPSRPISLLMVTHDPLLATMADRILLLRDGRVISPGA
ncbi:ABC transporter ATP-binding protein [SAR202 cluster bacterium AC-647-N09_OGT_505m]|nr:ABC transporter ATP-binding protein [SAR202 cluster bacterium AC-647-N09_OGT_505m]